MGTATFKIPAKFDNNGKALPMIFHDNGEELSFKVGGKLAWFPKAQTLIEKDGDEFLVVVPEELAIEQEIC